MKKRNRTKRFRNKTKRSRNKSKIQKTRRKRIKRHSRKKGGAEEIQSELATKTFWDDNGSYRDGKLLNKVTGLLANGVDVNAVDEDNNTPLHHALMKFRMDPRVVSLLLDKDADVRAMNKDNNTPLHTAVLFGASAEVVSLLLKKDVDVSAMNKDKDTPLHCALNYQAKPKVVTLLLDKGFDVNAVNTYKKTPLHTAVKSRASREVVKLLLEKDADVHAVDEYKNTALHFAAEKEGAGVLPVVALLLEKGANVNDMNNSNNTPLHTAVKSRADPEVVSLLLEKDADVHAVDKYRNTPLTAAVKYGASPEVVKLLLEKGGADVRAVNNYNMTVLHYAAYPEPPSQAHPEVVKLLLDNGADVHAVIANDMTPLILANKTFAPPEVVELLTTASEKSNVDTAASGEEQIVIEKAPNGPPVEAAQNKVETHAVDAEKKKEAPREVVELLTTALKKSKVVKEEAPKGPPVVGAQNKVETPAVGAEKKKAAPAENNCPQELCDPHTRLSSILVDPNFWTPIHERTPAATIKRNVKNVVDKCGANVNARHTVTGVTPLHYAAVVENGDMAVEYLLSNGANPLKMDKNRKTPRDWAENGPMEYYWDHYSAGRERVQEKYGTDNCNFWWTTESWWKNKRSRHKINTTIINHLTKAEKQRGGRGGTRRKRKSKRSRNKSKIRKTRIR